MKTGEIRGCVRIPTTDGFVKNNGKVFDLREYHDRTWLMPSDKEDMRTEAILELDPSTVADGGKLGVLIAEYNPEERQTLIYSHKKTNEILGGYKGFLQFL